MAEREDLSTDKLEALLRLTADYVQPSRDLRPQVIEAARERYIERKLRSQLLLVSAATFLVAIGVQYFATEPPRPAPTRDALIGATSGEMLALAETRVVQRSAGWNWGLVDLFFRLREQQADSLGASEQSP
jgi:hypothetical protein